MSIVLTMMLTTTPKLFVTTMTLTFMRMFTSMSTLIKARLENPAAHSRRGY